MRRKQWLVALGVLFAACLLALSTLAGQVEVLHWWTSSGEAGALAELQQRLAAVGHRWKDFAVAGGGGENAMIFLRSRIIAGNPPAAAQIKGPSIQEWAAQGVLLDLDPLAREGRWDSRLPGAVADLMKYQGHYVAVPVNIHRVNWMWVNPNIFKRAGADIPVTWEDFEIAAQKIQKAGFLPVAHGGQPWQEATLFESIVLAVGGADFYRKALVKLDPDALNSPSLVKSFEILRTVKSYTDKAAMQFMGDWAKGEFAAAGQVPGKDYICAPMPGTQGMYIFSIDSFTLFQSNDPQVQQAQLDLVRIIMDPAFQQTFNLKKGSIPVQLDIPMDAFDRCARESRSDFMQSDRAGTLVPSMAHHMATITPVQEAIYDVVTEFYNSAMTPEDAAAQLAQAVRENR